MKTLSARNQSLTLEQNIHEALKREFLYAEPIVDGQVYRVGSSKKEVQVLWEKNILCEMSINTNEGKCFVMYSNS